jgi:Vitamin K-dependent gamma-carboxylase
MAQRFAMTFFGSSDVMHQARSNRTHGSLLQRAQHALRAAFNKGEAFFFAPDRTRWELVRIGAGMVVLGTLLLTGLSGNYERLYGHWGSLPRREALDVIHWPGVLFLLNSDPMWIWRIYGITCVMALLLAVGLWTRVAAVATWFLYVATIQRNLISFNGETGILAFVLLGLAFAPAPQRLSTDHLVLKRPLPMQGEVWPARFIQLNVCLMYFFTTVAKLLSSWDLGRGEIWYEITLSDWFRFPEWDWLRTPLVCWLAVHGSLLMEGSFPFLVWTRLRVPIVLAMMCLHAAIAMMFSNALFAFNLTAIVALCTFLRRDDFGVRPVRQTETEAT